MRPARKNGQDVEDGRVRGVGYCKTKEETMPNQVYKSIELTGASDTSIEDAIRIAIDRAGKTIRNMSWFEVVQTRGYVEKNQIAYWQVTVKIGFTVE
jgi:flavin-binding protein dodecin